MKNIYKFICKWYDIIMNVIIPGRKVKQALKQLTTGMSEMSDEEFDKLLEQWENQKVTDSICASYVTPKADKKIRKISSKHFAINLVDNGAVGEIHIPTIGVKKPLSKEEMQKEHEETMKDIETKLPKLRKAKPSKK